MKTVIFTDKIPGKKGVEKEYPDDYADSLIAAGVAKEKPGTKTTKSADKGD